MLRVIVTAICLFSLASPVIGAFTVTQLNTNGDQNGPFLREGEHWTVDEALGIITIIQGHATETFVFEATDGVGGPLTDINAVQSFLTSGTIKLMIAGDVNNTTPGATAVKKIAIDLGTVQSEIVGINITGDLLETEAMTVDSFSGDVVSGAHIHINTDQLSGNDVLGDIIIDGDVTGHACERTHSPRL